MNDRIVLSPPEAQHLHRLHAEMTGTIAAVLTSRGVDPKDLYRIEWHDDATKCALVRVEDAKE